LPVINSVTPFNPAFILSALDEPSEPAQTGQDRSLDPFKEQDLVSSLN
jgi:hypothetical protein